MRQMVVGVIKYLENGAQEKKLSLLSVYCYILSAFLKDESQCRTNLNKYSTQVIIIANWVSIG